jgi:Lectin C-type domain
MAAMTESQILFSPADNQYALDYVFIPGLGFYKYYSTLVPWAVAKATCEQDGAHLAILNSQQEADALKKLVVNTSVEWAWLGLVKSDPKGEFVTIFGNLQYLLQQS